MKNPGQTQPGQQLDTKTENKENITAKGEQRLEKYSKSIDNAKANVSKWFTSAGSMFKRLGRGTVVGILSTPEIAAAGGKAIAKGAEYVGEGAKAIGGKIEGKLSDISYALDDAGIFLNETLPNLTKAKIDSAKESIKTGWEQLGKHTENAINKAQLRRAEAKANFFGKINKIAMGVLERNGQKIDKLKSKVDTQSKFNPSLAG